MITIDNINISSHSVKAQYALLDTTNICGEPLKEISEVSDKFTILFDVSYMISILDRICDLDDDFTDELVDIETITKLAYSIINTSAHYRHYIFSKMKRRNTIIMYASNAEHYDQFAKTFSLIVKITNLLRKTIFIEKVSGPKNFLYSHIAYFTADRIRSLNVANGRRTRIMYVGNNPMASQLLRIDREMVHVKKKSVKCGLEIAFASSILNLKNMGLIDKRNTDLISCILAVIGAKNGFPKLASLKGQRNEKIYYTMFENCLDGVDKDNPESIVKGLNLPPVDSKFFVSRMKMMEPDFQNKTYTLTKSLFKVWQSKIATNAMSSFNDFFENNEIELNINWLMEC